MHEPYCTVLYCTLAFFVYRFDHLAPTVPYLFRLNREPNRSPLCSWPLAFCISVLLYRVFDNSAWAVPSTVFRFKVISVTEPLKNLNRFLFFLEKMENGLIFWKATVRASIKTENGLTNFLSNYRKTICFLVRYGQRWFLKNEQPKG
jgi:hypothetical protein